MRASAHAWQVYNRAIAAHEVLLAAYREASAKHRKKQQRLAHTARLCSSRLVLIYDKLIGERSCDAGFLSVGLQYRANARYNHTL